VQSFRLMCIVEFKKNQELQISNPCGRQQQQQQHSACAGMTVAALTHNIATVLREPVAGNHKILSEDHVDCCAIFSEQNVQIVSAAQRSSSL